MLFWQALALMLVFEGIPFFLDPRSARQAMRWIVEEMSDRNMRWIGFFSMILGLALLYALR